MISFMLLWFIPTLIATIIYLYVGWFFYNQEVCVSDLGVAFVLVVMGPFGLLALIVAALSNLSDNVLIKSRKR